MTSTSGIDIKEVIQASTADVSLAELQRKGFSKVKVLNREAIQELIAAAVDRVIAERLAVASDKDRKKLEEVARARFEKILTEQRQTAQTLKSYEEKVRTLESELAVRTVELRAKSELETELRAELARRDEEMRARPAQATGDLKAIQEGLEKLSRKIASGALRTGEEVPEGKAAEFAVKAMLSAITDVEVESNVQQVNAKKAIAGGLGKTLNKLKSLQKGTES